MEHERSDLNQARCKNCGGVFPQILKYDCTVNETWIASQVGKVMKGAKHECPVSGVQHKVNNIRISPDNAPDFNVATSRYKVITRKHGEINSEGYCVDCGTHRFEEEIIQ